MDKFKMCLNCGEPLFLGDECACTRNQRKAEEIIGRQNAGVPVSEARIREIVRQEMSSMFGRFRDDLK